MAQWEKTLAAKPDDPSSVISTALWKERNGSHCPLTYTQTLYHTPIQKAVKK